MKEEKLELNYVFSSESEMIKNSEQFYKKIKKRRTVRDFSTKPVDFHIIKNAILAAGTSPNGANLQPWHFVVIENCKKKSELRKHAEKIESDFYSYKAPEEWKNDLKHLGTNESKPFLEQAPFIIAVFEKKYDFDSSGNRKKLYYTKESVGIATGILITALHFSGLATLTYTPENMLFLNKMLNRPKNEKPFLLVVTGLPKENATVPKITKKSFDEITTRI